MKIQSYLILALILLTPGCTDDTIQVEEDEVIGEISDNQLSIFNSSDQNIYYAVFDQSILPFILWAPISSEENRIPGFHKKTFDISEILRDGNTTGTIIFYFWVEEDQENVNVKFLRFDITD